jgi:hypothetical protein
VPVDHGTPRVVKHFSGDFGLPELRSPVGETLYNVH